MKYLLLVLILTSVAAAGFAACRGGSSPADNAIPQSPVTLSRDSSEAVAAGDKMKITIGSNTFTAILFDSQAAAEFKARLPLTLKMDDLNENEKKYDFPKAFTTDSSKPGTINGGDLMIWSGNTLVLFYKTFSSPYSYTRLGRIDNSAGLEDALGAGSVTVTFELQ